ncbi:MAG: SCO family protein [Proteobacteria bacterium]|nr:SCO family protein [Pseudomonadota bacterium]
MRRLLAAVGAALLATAAAAATDPAAALAPRTEFTPPPAGSYELQRIQRVGDATLLDDRGTRRRLAALTHGKVTLLTFFYTECPDALGCPFAFGTLNLLRGRLLARPAGSPDVRFVSISLDPAHDSPAVLRGYAGPLSRDPRLEWRFLTASSVASLLPVLEDFGQDVSVETDAHGVPQRTRHHMLKLYLIDDEGTVREIYTLAFIQPEVILNDIDTLLLAARRRS